MGYNPTFGVFRVETKTRLISRVLLLWGKMRYYLFKVDNELEIEFLCIDDNKLEFQIGVKYCF